MSLVHDIAEVVLSHSVPHDLNELILTDSGGHIHYVLHFVSLSLSKTGGVPRNPKE